MAKPKETLVEAIDRTAFSLLSKIGGEGMITAQNSAILTEQVKAFGEIVKWAAARKDLIPKEDANKDAKFASIKDKFHAASGKTGSRRSPDTTPPEGSDERAGTDTGVDDETGGASSSIN